MPPLKPASLLVLLAGLFVAPFAAAQAQDAVTTASPRMAAAAASDPAALFATHCASCHGASRTGGTGPALLPESLERLKKAEAVKVIGQGRPATQMLPFADRLSADQIKAVADWIYTPVVPTPTWSEADMAASRWLLPDADKLPAKPVFAADPMNVFLVVETGDHHVSVLDGDKLEPIHRFQSRYALHGGPKFTKDGRYVFFASRDGWVTKYDLWNLKVVGEIRAGLNTRNVAVSADGEWVMVANYLPRTLVLLSAKDLAVQRIYPVTDASGKQSSRVSAVYTAAPRHSFVVALKDVPEAWEIRYDKNAPEVWEGLVHDYRMREGNPLPGQFTPRRIKLDQVLDDFFFTQDYVNLLGASREATKGQVVNLDVRRKIADLDLSGMPHLGSGITFDWQGKRVMASPNLSSGKVTVIDTDTWKTVATIPTLGPGFFLRSHEKSPYAWVDSMMSPEGRDTLQVIDKRTLEVVAKLRPEPGKTLAHVEFDRYGKYVLASLWEQDGALIVFDAATLKEVKRIPMKKPVGKYNVFNKINLSEGTSH